jgi:hypothetical protein
MAVTSKTLYRGAAATSSATLYTVPNSSTVTVVTDIVVTNTTTANHTFSVSIDAVSLASSVTVGASDSTLISLKQVIPANATPKTITGFASTTAVNFHISGVEIV